MSALGSTECFFLEFWLSLPFLLITFRPAGIRLLGTLLCISPFYHPTLRWTALAPLHRLSRCLQFLWLVLCLGLFLFFLYPWWSFRIRWAFCQLLGSLMLFCSFHRVLRVLLFLFWTSFFSSSGSPWAEFAHYLPQRQQEVPYLCQLVLNPIANPFSFVK